MSTAPAYTVLLVFQSPLLERFHLARHRTRGWELPGGRLEHGEDILTGARREWTEETGLPLALLEPLVLHERPDGSLGHVFLGAVHAGPGPHGTDRVAPPEEERIVAVRAVEALSAVRPLAFPDDPYAAVAAAVWERAKTPPWSRLDGETRERFVRRLSEHDEAHPVPHRVRPHPAAHAAT